MAITSLGTADVDLSEYVDNDVSSDVSGSESTDTKAAAEQAIEDSAEQSSESVEETKEPEETDASDNDKEPAADTAPSIADDTEIDIDGAPIKVAEMKVAWVKQREQQADYTRKTQALAEQRRDFEKKTEVVRGEINRMFSDPDYLLATLKRRARPVLHDALVKYSVEYQELLDLKANDIAEYYRRVDKEQREIDRLNLEERSQTEKKERESAEYRRIVEEASRVINENREKELTKAGVLPKNADKAFTDYVQKRFKEAYLIRVNTERGVRVTPDFIASIAKELSEDDGIKAKLEILKSQKTAPKKNTATITKTQQSSSGSKPTTKRTPEKITHENFFDRIANTRL